MVQKSIDRRTLALDGQRVSYLCGGEGSPVLLLHGTFWSRVWLPILPILAQSHAVFALDYPGFGAPKEGSTRKRPQLRPRRGSFCGRLTL